MYFIFTSLPGQNMDIVQEDSVPLKVLNPSLKAFYYNMVKMKDKHFAVRSYLASCYTKIHAKHHE